MKKGLFIFVCILAFLVSFVGSALFKMNWTPRKLRSYQVKWSDQIGRVYKDLRYGPKEANTFDLYVPADANQGPYGLVVYLHAGGFRTGDKNDDTQILQWLCSLGYVAAGVNYTLNNDQNPDASIQTMSTEVKESIPSILEEADKLGYPIDRMAIAGGSAGGCLALLYAYRDADQSPVPVRMVFEGVGPSSFYPEDWKSYGLDQNPEAAAALFSAMCGSEITADMIGTPAYDEAIKDVSPLLWVNENTVPSLLAYGKYDTIQPFAAAKRLEEALSHYQVPHEFIVFEHSGHGLQNDTQQSILYSQKIKEYLDTYMAR